MPIADLRAQNEWLRIGADGEVSVPPGSFLASVPVDLALHTAATVNTNIASGIVAFSTARQLWFDLSGFTQARLAASLTGSTQPSGMTIAVQYLKPDGATWAFLDGLDGPKMRTDAAFIAGWADGVIHGDYVTIVEEARADVRLRLVFVGGNGTGSMTINRSSIQVVAQAGTPGGGAGDPPENMPPCTKFPVSLEGYATFAAMLADGWVETDPENVVTLDLAAHPGTPFEKAIKVTVTTDPVANPYEWTFVKRVPAFAGLGDSYAIQFTQWPVSNGTPLVFTTPFTRRTYIRRSHPTPGDGMIEIGVKYRITGGGTGAITPNGLMYIADIEIQSESCSVPSVPVVGEGDIPTGPLPTPQPIIGPAIFGAYQIPDTGAGYWNSTIKQIEKSYAVAMLTRARSAGMRLWLSVLGSQSTWNPGGHFSLSASLAQIDLLGLDATVKAAMQAAFNDGTSPGIYLMDEPNHVGRYGSVITNAMLGQMAVKCAGYWPGVRIAIRTDPIGRPQIAGITTWWAQYRKDKGEVRGYLADMIAASQGIGTELVIGMNVIDFSNDATGRIRLPGTIRSSANAADLANYGSVLADSTFPIAFMMWQFRPDWYAQDGVPEAVQQLLAKFQASHP